MAAELFTVFAHDYNCKRKILFDFKAFENGTEVIIKFGVQGPLNHRSDAAFVEYIHIAVARLDREQPAVLQCVTAEPPLRIHKLYTALDSAWMRHDRLPKAKIFIVKSEVETSQKLSDST